MPSAFPIRRIDKDDPKYADLFLNVFVLQPSFQGATAHDILRFAEEIKSAFEVKGLSENDSILRASFAGRGLTLPSLKDVVAEILSNNPVEWVRGCTGVSLMHHPESREKLVSVLSRLPESIRRGQKLLSIPHLDGTVAFDVQLCENSFVATDGLYVWLDNPEDPAAEFVTPSNGHDVTFRDVYESKQKMEYFAMLSFCAELISSTSLTHGDLKCRYEPLGDKTFPDFELIARGLKWAVEVTRIESGMVSYLTVTPSLEKRAFDRAAENQITESRIVAALTKAAAEKAKRLNECQDYSRGCLLLVDVVDSVGPKSSAIWEGIDLSAFEVVAVVKLDGNVTFIKGANTF